MSPIDRTFSQRGDGETSRRSARRLRFVDSEPGQSAIAHENASASATTDADARLVFAREVARGLDGGRAALLRPDARRRVLSLASRVGLRPFDAHLIIAAVQDRTRRGEGVDQVRPVLATLGAPVRNQSPRVLRAVLAALAGAAIIMAALVWLIASTT